MDENQFVLVGIRQEEGIEASIRQKWYKGKPVVSFFLLAVIALGCLCSEFFIPRDPAYMDLAHCNLPPNRAFWFGTDIMGRDIFSMVWHGGRLSLLIGFGAALISSAMGILVGAVSGLSRKWMDRLIMRLTEILLSIPSLLFIILVQAVMGKANVFSIAFVIGLTGWPSIAKVVRTEVRQLRCSEYVLASRCMGGGFFHILRKHLTPNIVSSIMFMVVMNIRSAIAAESTLSFMGIGLPLETVTWGSMLTMSENALLSGSWWMILIPGLFLVATLLCITDAGSWLHRQMNRKQSNL